MSTAEIIIIAVVIIATVIAGYVEIRHHKNLIKDVQTHIASSNIALHNAVKEVGAKVDKAVSNTSASVEAKKAELKDWLEKINKAAL
ncbi:MAG: hypothetical protein KGJ89_05130 [Patescibacteria group bacterium]|nr:hypothetical protein [Patescibacteria group bacterium]MDE2227305.1 hypothetical protein [Patescibacteria group bacterium]